MTLTNNPTQTWNGNNSNFTFTGTNDMNMGTGAVSMTANTTVTASANTGVVAVNNAGTKLRFGSVSQTLSSLTIGAGATVVFTSGPASGAFSGDDKGAGFGSFGAAATVPEPGTIGLLLVGALGMLNRRRRA